MAGRAPAELLEDEKKHCQGLPVDFIPIARKAGASAAEK